MKTVFTIVAGISHLLLSGCAEFPTDYSIIEDEKTRLIDFIYEPAEAAPGDTVLCKAIFAGKPVNRAALTWKISKKIIVNDYDVDAALDTVPLDITYEDYEFSDSTSSVAFTFVLPKNLIAASPYVPARWSDQLPIYYQKALPSSIPQTKKEMLGIMGSTSSFLDHANSPDGEATAALLPAILQCCTAPVYLYCSGASDHTIFSKYSVRYNRRLTGIPGLTVPINRNPVIDSACLYVVKKKYLSLFNPHKNTDSRRVTPLVPGHVTTVVIDKESSYFIGVFTGNRDTTLSIDASMGNGKPLVENHFSHWYIRYNADEKKDASTSELMAIDGGTWFTDQLVSTMYPPNGGAIHEVVAWVEITDGFINEMCRPVGSTVGEYRFHFKYK